MRRLGLSRKICPENAIVEEIGKPYRKISGNCVKRVVCEGVFKFDAIIVI